MPILFNIESSRAGLIRGGETVGEGFIRKDQEKSRS